MIPGAPLILRSGDGKTQHRSLRRGGHQSKRRSGGGGGLEAKPSRAKLPITFGRVALDWSLFKSGAKGRPGWCGLGGWN